MIARATVSTVGRDVRSTRVLVIALLLGVASTLGFGPVPQAHAAAYCNLYPPSRIAIWQVSQPYVVTYGAGCEASGARQAGWLNEYDDVEDVGLAVVSWERGDGPSDRLRVTDYAPKGATRWVPLGGEPEDLIQNTPTTTVKLGSVAYVSVRRSAGYHEVTARAYHYSSATHAIVPSGSRPGQVQFREPGDNTWRPVSGVTVGSDGRVTIRTWSPGPRYYRVSFGEQPTLWNAVSEQVRAR